MDNNVKSDTIWQRKVQAWCDLLDEARSLLMKQSSKALSTADLGELAAARACLDEASFTIQSTRLREDRRRLVLAEEFKPLGGAPKYSAALGDAE